MGASSEYISSHESSFSKPSYRYVSQYFEGSQSDLKQTQTSTEIVLKFPLPPRAFKRSSIFQWKVGLCYTQNVAHPATDNSWNASAILSPDMAMRVAGSDNQMRPSSGKGSSTFSSDESPSSEVVSLTIAILHSRCRSLRAEFASESSPVLINTCNENFCSHLHANKMQSREITFYPYGDIGLHGMLPLSVFWWLFGARDHSLQRNV